MKKTKKISTSMNLSSGKAIRLSQRNDSPTISKILMVLVGVLTWCMTYLANTLPDSPLVELTQSYKKSGENTQIKIKISNLSRGIRISDLKLGLSSPEKSHGKFSNYFLFALAPAAQGERSRAYTLTDEETVMFEIGDIHPGQHFVLTTTYTGIDRPEARLVSANQPVYMLNSGLITALVKWIVPALLVIAFIVICYFLYSLVRHLANDVNHRK